MTDADGTDKPTPHGDDDADWTERKDVAGPGWSTQAGAGSGPGWGSAPSYDAGVTSSGAAYDEAPIQDPSVGAPVDFSKRTGDTPMWPSEPAAPEDQPQYGQSQYGQQQYGQAGQQPYGQQPYGQPVYGQPQYAVDPSAPYGRDPLTGEPFSDKEKIVAGLLQILLGVFGAGRFYTGHTGIAIAQIAVSWLTCGLGALWPLIDGIMMLTGNVRDVNGRKLRP